MNTVSQSNVSMMLPFDVDHQLFDECIKPFQSTGNLCRAKKNSCKFKRHSQTRTLPQIVKPINKQIGFNAPTSSYNPEKDGTMKRTTNFLYQYIIQDASSIVSLNTTRSSKESSTGGEEICTMQLSVSTTPTNPLLLFTPPTPSEKKFIENRINQENSVKESFQFRNGNGPLFAPIVPPPSQPAS